MALSGIFYWLPEIDKKNTETQKLSKVFKIHEMPQQIFYNKLHNKEIDKQLRRRGPTLFNLKLVQVKNWSEFSCLVLNL